MATNKRVKNVIFTENNDEHLFKSLGKYHVFDKNIVIQQNINDLLANKTKNYLANQIIEKELTKCLRNKKFDVLIFILQGSSVDTIMNNIISNIYPNIKNTVDLRFPSLEELINNQN